MGDQICARIRQRKQTRERAQNMEDTRLCEGGSSPCPSYSYKMAVKVLVLSLHLVLASRGCAGAGAARPLCASAMPPALFVLYHPPTLPHAGGAEQRLLELGLSPEAAAEWCFWCLCQVIVHDVNELTEKLFPIVEAMQKHFSAGSGTYYSDSIFFLSVAMHRIMPKGRLVSAVLQQHRLSFSSAQRCYLALFEIQS